MEVMFWEIVIWAGIALGLAKLGQRLDPTRRRR